MALLPLSLQAIFDDAGNRVFDGLLYVYAAGTTTPKPPYADAGYGTALSNPVAMRGNGTFPVIYLPPGSYRLRIADPLGYQYAQIEDFAVDAPSSGGGGGGGSVDDKRLAQTGDVKDRYGAGLHAGWVRMNGRTIGATASSASERANDDTHDLFVFLWSQDANLAVSGGRGPNAESDWAAAKTIALPDQRGRSRFAVDEMGNTNSGRLNGGLFTFGGTNGLGAYGGEASHVQTLAELASHPTTITASMDAQGAHLHTGATDLAQHNHQFTTAANKNGIAATGGGGAIIQLWNGPDTAVATTGTNVSYSFTTSTAPAHAHNITASASNAGSSASMNWLPPFILVTSYIKL